MKILILANNDVGLYQFRRELIEELLKDNEVYISLPYGELVNPLSESGCSFVNTPIDRRGINPFTDIKLLFNYTRIIKKINPDMVITYTIKPNIYGALASRMKRIQYAVNITGLGTAFQKEGLLKKMVIAMYKMSCKKAKVVFFENSGNQKVFIDEHIVKEDKTYVLPGAGVNLDHYSYIDYPEDNDETRFLFIGRVMKEKGIDELLSVMRRLISEGYNCSLDVVGGYEENYKDIVDSYVKEGWIRYHGYQKDVRPFIAQSHCFVLPSWHEGMANTNLECAASGRPVITSNIHGCLESVEDSVTGYLTKKQNSEDLHSVMKKMCELSSEERKTMGIMGRKRMEDVFDKKKVVEETIRCLQIN